MSLYGSGRSEGIGSVLLIAAVVITVLVVGELQVFGFDMDYETATLHALVPAVAGATFYRFVRAQGRSRYAAFLTGLAYALSPWLLSMSVEPREHLAAALAPLALEAAIRCRHPAQRSAWMPWAGVCIGAPFLAGNTAVAWFAVGLAAVLLAPVARGDGGEASSCWRGVGCITLLTIASAVAFASLDVFGLWRSGLPASPADVLGAHQPGRTGIDLAAVLRVPGPFLVFFLILGVLRRQRHTFTVGWLLLMAVAALPTLLVETTRPPTWICSSWVVLDPWPAAVWFLCLVAAGVLAAAGIDDFLDLPLRRRTAVAWLLALVVGTAPAIPLNSAAPELDWPLTATLLLLALLLPLWRRLGILRWKSVHAATVVVALAVLALQVLPSDEPLLLPALPAGEIAWHNHARPPVPIWPYALLGSVSVCTAVWAWFAFRRRTKARPAPSKARAAIVKKPRPPQRS